MFHGWFLIEGMDVPIYVQYLCTVVRHCQGHVELLARGWFGRVGGCSLYVPFLPNQNRYIM